MSSVGAFDRLVSRQAAHPSGFLGEIIGRIWVRETAGVNDAVLAAVEPQPRETVLEIGHGPGRFLSRINTGAEAVGVEVPLADPEVDELLSRLTPRSARNPGIS